MDTGLNLDIHENVFASPDEIFQRLEKEIEYIPPEACQVCVKGKVYPISRQIAAFGDPDLTYAFSGLTISSKPWTPLLLEIKNLVEIASGSSYNFVLVNRYPDGNAYIGQHKDDEIDLEENYAISSLSFGETRTMVFKKPNCGDQKIDLKSNSLLVMKHPTNKEWSHGIPRQKKRTGVRINLTFRKMKASSSKRKYEEDLAMTRDCKKAKREESKGSAVFTEDEIPEGVFSIGDSVFVLVNTFKDHVAVHIRRFKKYGKTYYPTTEGVTLQPWWTEYIMGRKKVPETSQDLRGGFGLPDDQIQITSHDFRHFTFMRIKSGPNGESISKSIMISSEQWHEMLNQYNAIAMIVLDHVYRAMDFVKAFELVATELIQETSSNSPDTAYLLQVLQNSVSDCIKEKGGLKDPEMKDCEELWANRVESFNSTAFSVEVTEIANSFHERLWFSQEFWVKQDVCITREFLKNVRLDILLRESRKVLCPPNAFEYFEDCE